MANALFKILQMIGRRDWIRFGVRRRLVRGCWRIWGRDYPFETEVFGMRYAGNLQDYVDRCVYFFGGYEKSLLSLLRGKAEEIPDAVFVDVGANVGQHTLFMSRFCREVHAFEPLPMNLQRLETNIRLNGISNVRLHPCGLGNVTGSFPFHVPSEDNLGIGAFLDAEHGVPSGATEKLPVAVADDYFPEHKIRPDIIKIDVEGFEARVLAGMQEVLKVFRPVVVLEFSMMLRDQLKDKAELERLFPYPVRIRRVVSFGRWRYGLDEFRFEPSDILVEPMELESEQA
ncbi:FkbM family methyltransferase [Alcanivorax sp.]|uniref:FkbM family methyltransferase n=1 Tax=Alcanivorax sp. TaxID=1872427 RepID=UPI0025882D8F|nr:FkbM family methyltransferase [Alcanivorax sp.]